jgi:predicted nicotinamide N-methyase
MTDPTAITLPRTVQTIDLGAMTLKVETVQSFDALLDRYAKAHPSDVDRIPYFAQLWPAALALARFLVSHPCESTLPPSLAGLRAVELGCGLGLPSLAAAHLGAEVLAVDFHPDNESLFRRNAALNGLKRIRYLTANWANFETPAQFDLVLGSDLLYERRSVGSLIAAMTRLCAPGGRILLADPGRDAIQSATSDIEFRGFRQLTHVTDNCFVIEFVRPANADKH